MRNPAPVNGGVVTDHWSASTTLLLPASMASMEKEVLSEYVKIRVNNILERENLLKNSGVLTDIGALKKTNVKDGHFQPYQKVCTCKEACQEEKEDL